MPVFVLHATFILQSMWDFTFQLNSFMIALKRTTETCIGNQRSKKNKNKTAFPLNPIHQVSDNPFVMSQSKL